MPTPISPANSSVYDPTAQFSPVSGPKESSPPSAAEVTLAPVVIQGDAGAAELVKRYDASSPPPSCSLAGANAALSCGKAAVAAAGGLVISSTGLGAAIGVAAAFTESISCGKDLRSYYDCKTP